MSQRTKLILQVLGIVAITLLAGIYLPEDSTIRAFMDATYKPAVAILGAVVVFNYIKNKKTSGSKP